MSSGNVEINRFRTQHTAECERCDGLDPDSTRERCRVHAEQTGHIVWYLIEDTTVYKRKGPS